MSTHPDSPTTQASVRTSAVNRHHSRLRSAFVFGPVAVPATETIADRLVTMAAAGAHTRIGLRPDPHSASWGFDPQALRRVVCSAPDPGDDPLALLSAVRGHEADPLRVATGGNHIAIDFDHGLGDAGLLNAVADVILGVNDPADPATWQRYTHRTPVLAVAAARVAVDPRRLVGLLGLLRRTPSAHTAAGATEVGTAITVSEARERPAALGYRLSEDCLREVRDARRAAMPGVGIYALTTVALVNALTEAGILLEECVTTPFDARGYLPRSRSTLGNFSAGLAFPVPPGSSPAGLQQALSHSTRIGRPVANLALVEVKTRLIPARHRPPDTLLPRISLLHSSVGHIPGGEHRFSWLDNNTAQVLAIADPPQISGLTITSALVGGGICFGAAYHTKTIAPQTLASAMNRVEHHLRELVGLPGSP